MKKAVGGIILLMLLAGCQQPTYQKVDGQVIKIDTYDRDVTVSYSLSDGKYQIDEVSFDSDDQRFYQIKVNQKVTVYANQNGIEEIAK